MSGYIAEEMCSPCFTKWMNAPIPDYTDVNEVPRTIPAEPPRPDGRHKCPGCGWLGATRSLSSDGLVETVKLC